MAIVVIAFGLMAIGFVGVIFGRLIQAAVSRQREFLADASAVQFTRNPDGIAGALKTIGGFQDGAKLISPHAAESAHMMFGNAVSNFGGAFATHPPLPQRIKRLDPSWDGANPRTVEQDGGNLQRSAAAAGFAGGGGAVTVPNVGEAGTLDVEAGPRVLANVPDDLRSAARQSVGAQALLLCLLLDRDEAVREKQFRLLEGGLNEAVLREAVRLAPPTVRLDRSLRLPVLSLCVPALSRMAAYEYRKLRELVESLVAADDETDRFEWALLEVLERQVGGHHGDGGGLGNGGGGGRVKLAAEPEAAGLVLAALASAAGDPAAAWAAATTALRQVGGVDPVTPAGSLTRSSFGAALERLSSLRPDGQRAVLAACTAAVKQDGVIDRQEAELLRVVAEAMGIPLPPIAAV